MKQEEKQSAGPAIMSSHLTCVNQGFHIVCDPQRRLTQCLVLFKLKQAFLDNKSKFDEQVKRRPARPRAHSSNCDCITPGIVHS